MTSRLIGLTPSRRTVLGGLAASGAALALPARFASAQSAAPIKLGFQLHRTGIGAAYGRWYERTAQAALKLVNEAGGINGRPVEILFEDDGTDPKRGAEVMEKFASQSNCDAVFGALFSHVVVGTAPRAGELKMPYLVCSEGHHVASGKMNRWTLQPGITDVKSQVQAMAPWISETLGKKVTMIFPDYAFGHDHRDAFVPAIQAAGGEVIEQIAIPPTETSFTRYLPRIPAETEVIYHVMVGPAVLTFVKELGEFYGSGDRPQIFGFIDSLEAVNIASPGLEFLEGTHFWEGHCRYLQEDAGEHEAAYRAAVGVDDTGASLSDAKDVSTYAHMFSVWETLFILKAGMEAAGYQGPADRQKLVEAIEAMTDMPYGIEHPQGAKTFNGKTHQVFGLQYISKVEGGKLVKVHTTALEDGMYPDEADYTAMSF
ncbi:ABC transporter substrate-binding protein [Frigidibacter mobilis]|uniref:Branched chain amino acid ABC transporter periplasmic substrate-binding protein n=1 Tax=Frigidibacter mobilis TaxID=1335048 RepID=A0A159Z6S7_9RHOB|nr:ABC transporter substrate-binding protein [Frigidibacter mobilis]AMY70164.1 branched chain amino acid ABC transporter periplasmic substrate-binding protein [Frigidibacter mobilis]